MPFQSEKQRRYLHANHPEIAKRWERDYANGGISNHFRKRLAKGGYQNVHQTGAISQTPGNVQTGGGNGGGNGRHPPVPVYTGPTIAEIDDQKKAAANEKKLSRQQKYESDRAARKRQKRINYMLDRRANKKGYSQKNLNQLTMGSRPGFYGNVPTYDPLATRNVGISALDHVSKFILPQEKPNLFADYSNVGSRHPVIMNRGTTIQGTRPPEWVTGSPTLGPVQPGSTNPLFTNRGLTEELSTKDYTSSEPYWSDQEVEGGQWYDADGTPINNPDINPELASMVTQAGAKVTDRDEMKKNAQKFVDMYKEGKYDNLQLAIEDADRYNAGEKTHYEITTGIDLELREGGVARKNYYHGGILDINESEEIISDDGNDIELTAYNAAFDDPNDLSTGVKTLFQAKDGGRIGFRRGTSGAPGGGDPGMYSAPSSTGGNGGGGDDQEEDVAEMMRKMARQDIIERGPGSDVEKYDTQKQHLADIPGTLKTGPQQNVYKTRVNVNYAQEAYQQSLANQMSGLKKMGLQKLGKLGVMLVAFLSMGASLGDSLKALPKTISINKEDMKSLLKYTLPVGKAKKELIEALEIHKGGLLKDVDITNPNEMANLDDTDFPKVMNQLTDLTKIEVKDEDKDGGPELPEVPQVVSIGGESEPYAQPDFNYWGFIKERQAQKKAYDEKMAQENLMIQQPGLAYGQQFFNSGGLANLFRVKNQ